MLDALKTLKSFQKVTQVIGFGTLVRKYPYSTKTQPLPPLVSKVVSKYSLVPNKRGG